MADATSCRKSKMAANEPEVSNISETMNHIKIPTATTIFSGSTFLVGVHPISWDVDVC